MRESVEQSTPPRARARASHLIAVKPLNLPGVSAIDREIVGDSKPMREVKRFVAQVAACQSTVLITGESGTGKELVAQTIHKLSQRAGKPFVSINCGALSETLLESELFGYVKGAFTGATATKKGLFEAAHKGTIFLDEFGEMSPAMQVKLLRVLQERKVRPVGATGAEIAVDVQVIVATNKDLVREVSEGRFRQDLYYRVNVLTVELPPLRDRRSDIPALTRYLLDSVHKRAGLKSPAAIEPTAVLLLSEYHWAGNVRELENKLERLSVMVGGGASITADDVRYALKPLRKSTKSTSDIIECVAVFHDDESFDQYFDRRQFDRRQIELYNRVLESVGGNHAEAARKLKINRTTLHERIKLAKQRLAAC